MTGQCLALAASLCLGAADERPRVLLQPITYEGELSEPMRDVVRENLLDGLERSQYDVGSSGTGAEYRVSATLTFESRNYRLTLELADSEGQTLASSEERCELCGITEVEQMVADQAALLSEKIQSLIKARPMLNIESRPSGATISIDGTQIGSTPLRLPIAPGRHRTRAQLEGHFDQELEVDAVVGMRQSISFQLVRLPKQPSADEVRRKALRPWGFVSLGLGVSAVTAGGVLIGIDERPYQRECTGSDVDPDGNCRLRYNTLGGGIAAVVTGAVLTIVGATLIGLAYKKRRNGFALSR